MRVGIGGGGFRVLALFFEMLNEHSLFLGIKQRSEDRAGATAKPQQWFSLSPTARTRPLSPHPAAEIA